MIKELTIISHQRTGWYWNMWAIFLWILAAFVSWLAYFTSEVGTPAPISSTNLRKAGPGPGVAFNWFSLMWFLNHLWIAFEPHVSKVYKLISAFSQYVRYMVVHGLSLRWFHWFFNFSQPQGVAYPKSWVTDLLRSNVLIFQHPKPSSQLGTVKDSKQMSLWRHPADRYHTLRKRHRWSCKLSSFWNIWKRAWSLRSLLSTYVH